ncbi:hypothetical protein V1508DRAFT_405927 [Lipomyces doorenjongii]|uniref:uncharacterized protein n=1 Tax=Lipomyces doorenjongii TaxID=383834 RepID=UPI0034CF6469
MGDDDPDRIDEHNVHCDCLFFRKYYLPCRHIFLADCKYEILTEDVFGVIFENSGFEVYEGADGSLDRGDICAPTRRALTPKETLEMIRSRYYEIEKAYNINIECERREASGVE